MSKWAKWCFICVTFANSTSFGVVRAVTMDENSMAEIHLAMGRSTVLHFTEKPTKVIAGNQNYFNIEFTGQDITIQPLGPVTSNLFAYGEYHRYGFVLRVEGVAHYDDLVQIRWRQKNILPPALETRHAHEKRPNLPQKAGIRIQKAFFDSMTGLSIIEFEVKATSGATIRSKDLGITLMQEKKELPIAQLVFDRDTTTKILPTLKARAFFKRSEGKPVTLKVRVQGMIIELPIAANAFT